MSYTEIYKFKKNGNAESLADVRNSWRGAMAIWNILDIRYLPPYIPEWAKSLAEQKDRYYRSGDFDGEALKEVWALFDREDILLVDRIALGTTFDNVIVMREDIPKVISAFESFVGETSLPEQAAILTNALKNDDLIAIGWNQTSVNGDTWTNIGGYDEENEEYLPYNILTMTEHWNLFQDLSDALKP